MNPLEDGPMWSLNAAAKCEATDARLRALIVTLEREGTAPRVIAASLSRVLLGFCAEHARSVSNFGWISWKLAAVTDILEIRCSTADYRNWVGRFVKRQKRLYEEARRFHMQSDITPPPPPPFAVEIAEPQGRA